MSAAKPTDYCFTWFVDTPHQVKEAIHTFQKHQDKFVWGGFQLEKSDTGRLHLQGYCAFKQPRTWFYLKKLLKSKTVHIEERKGTHQECIDYVTKSARVCGPWVFGCKASRVPLKTT